MEDGNLSNLRPAGWIRPPVRNRPARGISSNYCKNRACRFLMSFKLPRMDNIGSKSKKPQSAGASASDPLAFVG